MRKLSHLEVFNSVVDMPSDADKPAPNALLLHFFGEHCAEKLREVRLSISGGHKDWPINFDFFGIDETKDPDAARMADTILRVFERIPSLQRVALTMLGATEDEEESFFKRVLKCGGERMAKTLKHSCPTEGDVSGNAEDVGLAFCQVFDCFV